MTTQEKRAKALLLAGCSYNDAMIATNLSLQRCMELLPIQKDSQNA